MPRAAHIFQLAELTSGIDPGGAARWLGLLQFTLPDLMYTAPAQLRAARLYARAGDSIRAGASYRRVLELWGAAAPARRAEIEEAQRNATRQLPSR